MVDLGLYNFIKNAVTESKSKEEIVAALAKGGWTPEQVEEAYTAVEHGDEPTVGTHTTTPRSILVSKAEVVELHRPTLITALCGYFFITTALSVMNLGLLSLLGQLPLSITVDNAPGIVLALFTFFSVIGYWEMKRWGVMLYTLTVFATVLIVVSNLHATTPLIILAAILPSTLLPGVMVYAGFVHLDQMS